MPDRKFLTVHLQPGEGDPVGFRGEFSYYVEAGGALVVYGTSSYSDEAAWHLYAPMTWSSVRASEPPTSSA